MCLKGRGDILTRTRQDSRACTTKLHHQGRHFPLFGRLSVWKILSASGFSDTSQFSPIIMLSKNIYLMFPKSPLQ